ncbi:MAG: hypothetical protein N2C14_01145 [Planctomycetales bacterium]
MPDASDQRPPTQPLAASRRWTTYSLRRLFVLMVIACVGFGSRWRDKQKDRDTVVALRKHGAQFLYDTHKVNRSERDFIHAKDNLPLNAAVDPQRL